MVSYQQQLKKQQHHIQQIRALALDMQTNTCWEIYQNNTFFGGSWISVRKKYRFFQATNP